MGPKKPASQPGPYRSIIPAFMANYAVLGVISPFLPILIRTLGYSPSMVGLLMGIYEGAGIVGPFVLGFLVDRWGRYKPGLLISVLLMLLPALPLALIHRPLPSALLLCVLAVGVKSGLPLMEAMTTIVVGKEGNYGKIRSFGSVGFILSVLFLQWFPYLPRNSALNIGIWIAILSSIALVMMCLVPARFTALRQDAAPRPATAPLRIWTPFFTLGLLMIALTRIAMAPVASFISLYVVEYIKWDAVGMIWAIAAAAETPLIFFSRRIIRYFKSPLKVIFLTCFALILRLLIYALFPYPPAIVAAQLLHSLCYGLFHSAAVAFISANIPPERRALGMTIYLSLGTGFPTFLGNILGGFIVEYLGYRALFGSYTIFSLLAMGVYLVIRGAGRTRTGYRAILPP